MTRDKPELTIEWLPPCPRYICDLCDTDEPDAIASCRVCQRDLCHFHVGASCEGETLCVECVSGDTKSAPAENI
jgi:hypothetical protein